MLSIIFSGLHTCTCVNILKVGDAQIGNQGRERKCIRDTFRYRRCDSPHILQRNAD